MAWTAPATASAGTTLLAAWLNTYLKDNMLATQAAILPASDTDLGSDRTTASTSYVALTGAPSVTVTTGTVALVHYAAALWNDTGGSVAYCSVAVSSATTRAADDDWAIYWTSAVNNASGRLSMTTLMTGLTPGSNVFTLNAKANANNMKGRDFEIVVIPHLLA